MSKFARVAIRKLHLWLGLALALYLCLIGISGAALVWGDELDSALNPRLLRVLPQGERASLARVLASWKQRFPDEPLRNLRLSDPHDAGAVYSAFAGSGEKSRTVYLDPYRANILGERVGVVKWISDLHFRLLLGDLGGKLNGWGALATMLILASGLWMWWPRTLRQLRLRTTWRKGRGWNVFARESHLAIGFWSSALLLIVALTGAVFIWWQPVQSMVYKVTGTTEDARLQATPRGARLDNDALMKIAFHKFPSAPLSGVSLPVEKTDVFRLYVALGAPGAWGPWGEVALDPYSGRVLRVVDGREYGVGKQIMALVFPLHAGFWGGGGAKTFTVKIVYTLAGLAPLALSIGGALIWWRKKRARLGNRRRREKLRARIASGEREVEDSEVKQEERELVTAASRSR